MTETATIAGGCFWCTEAIFKRLKGVNSVIPGYAGGSMDNPSYADVSTGETGHTEAVQIQFDPKIIPYEKILDVFWHTHDPTTPNRQGQDQGSQYRSAIYYHDERQHQEAQGSKKKIEAEGIYSDPIVTEILPFSRFYIAEDHHHNYYENNHNAPYCQFVIDPKIKQLLKEYKKEIKAEYL